MCVIHLGGDEAEYVRLHMRAHAHSASSVFWEGNPHACDVEVSVGPFRAKIESEIHGVDLAQFLKSVQRLYDWLGDEAVLETLEQWLTLRLIGDGRGGILVQGRLVDPMSRGNSLEFELSVDQTYLPPLITQLQAALRS